MADAGEEGVVFEIQVDRNLLESVLTENQKFRDIYRVEQANKKLNNELRALKTRLDNCEYEKCVVIGENLELKAQVDELAIYKRIFQEKDRSRHLEFGENNLLKMQLDQVLREKDKLINEFEVERKVLEDLIRDKTKLRKDEEVIANLQNEIKIVERNLQETNAKLTASEVNCQQLEHERFRVEASLRKLTERFRIVQEKIQSQDLESVENKVLRIKLQNLENDKKYLLDEFERERKLIERQNIPRVAKIEENLKLLRKWIEKEAKERFPKIPVEVAILQARVKTLEKEKKDLIEGFEMERAIFKKVLHKHNL